MLHKALCNHTIRKINVLLTDNNIIVICNYITKNFQ
jgi:hypothetical protein